MTTPDPSHAAEKPPVEANSGATSAAETLPPPDASPIPAKAKEHNIRVSPAVIDAAGKEGDELLQSLHTAIAGLTQAEAEERARTSGPNEVAQERRRGWFIRLLIILRNPLVILLAILSSISFATGDARAGFVMAGMVLLSAGLRFFQEARADLAAAKLKAMIPRNRHGGSRWQGPGDPTARPGSGRHHRSLRRRHDPGRRASHHSERFIRQPGNAYRGVTSRREVSRSRPQGC